MRVLMGSVGGCSGVVGGGGVINLATYLREATCVYVCVCVYMYFSDIKGREQQRR